MNNLTRENQFRLDRSTHTSLNIYHKRTCIMRLLRTEQLFTKILQTNLISFLRQNMCQTSKLYQLDRKKYCLALNGEEIVEAYKHRRRIDMSLLDTINKHSL